MEHKRQIILIVLLLLTLLGLKKFTKLETYDSSGLDQSSFPQKFKGWIGTDVEVSDVEKNFLPSDTLFVKKFYNNPKYGEVYLVVVFSGKDRRSIHRPEVCYPSQGWSIQEKTKMSVDVDHPIGKLNVTRLDVSFGKDGFAGGQVVFYWFMGNNRVTETHLKRVLFMGFDRCVYAKNYRWAFLRVSTDISSSGMDESLKTIEQFTSDLFPVIAGKDFKQY